MKIDNGKWIMNVEVQQVAEFLNNIIIVFRNCIAISSFNFQLSIFHF